MCFAPPPQHRHPSPLTRTTTSTAPFDDDFTTPLLRHGHGVLPCRRASQQCEALDSSSRVKPPETSPAVFDATTPVSGQCDAAARGNVNRPLMRASSSSHPVRPNSSSDPLVEPSEGCVTFNASWRDVSGPKALAGGAGLAETAGGEKGRRGGSSKGAEETSAGNSTMTGNEIAGRRCDAKRARQESREARRAWPALHRGLDPALAQPSRPAPSATQRSRTHRASRSDSRSARMSSSRTGPLTLRMIDRDVSSMNSTRTWVTPPREPVRPRTLMTRASLTGCLEAEESCRMARRPSRRRRRRVTGRRGGDRDDSQGQ
jgi:hypothetical protein